MLSSIPFFLAALVATFAALPLAAAQQITGSGTIAVLASNGTTTTSYTTTTPSDVVGCLNAAGKFTASDCATFTVEEYRISTEAGACSFYNASQPANTDAVYGNGVYAFYCWEHNTMSTDAEFYTVSGLPYNFMGQGDVDLYYDLPSLPENEDDELDMWFFVWGSLQYDVPEGHYKAMLLWEPTSS